MFSKLFHNPTWLQPGINMSSYSFDGNMLFRHSLLFDVLPLARRSGRWGIDTILPVALLVAGSW